MKIPLEHSGHSVNRADDLDKNQAILRDVLTAINEADVIVADLTATNPNVIYCRLCLRCGY